MAYGLSNGHVTYDVTWPRRCYEALRSAILATAWLVTNWRKIANFCNSAVFYTQPVFNAPLGSRDPVGIS